MQILQLTLLLKVLHAFCIYDGHSDEKFKAVGVCQFGCTLNSLCTFVRTVVCRSVPSWGFSSFAHIILKRFCSCGTLLASFCLKHTSEVCIAVCLALCDPLGERNSENERIICCITRDTHSDKYRFVALNKCRWFPCCEVNAIHAFITVVRRIAHHSSFFLLYRWPMAFNSKIRSKET